MNHPVLQVLAMGDFGELAELSRGERSDGELLDRFIHARDEDAFAAVVRRHGPMVFAVCRRVLGNHADADDAFQAAFLVLVRKAGSLGSRRPLGPWLHGVAFNTARRLQRAGRRRAAYERSVADLPDVAAEEPVNLSDELLKMLDEELSRLPARYRAPIVLCDLEGRTRRQAAAQLGCPEGTVAGRLARARALLAARLASRGVAPSAGVLAALLSQYATGAVHPERVASVVRMASGGPVPLRVSSLVERVVAAMFLQKVKSFAVVCLVLGGLLAAAGMGLRNEASAGPEPAAPPEAKKAAKPASAAEKVLTVFPLRKLDAAETATVISDTFRGKGVIVAPIPDERSLLLYADAKTTREVQALLLKLGDSSGKTASRIKLDRISDCRDASRVLTEVFNGPKPGATARVTVVPVPDENAILVYATPADTATIRSLMKVLDEGPAPAARGAFEDAPAAKKYTFAFRNTAWAEVLEWYARESGLTLVSPVKPTGNVTITPTADRKFTLGEITDLINESLMAQKFILVRGETTFFLHPADEKIDPAKIPRIELSELKKRGKTELVQVVIPVPAEAAQDLVPEIRKLLSLFGSATRVKDTLVLLDTVGNVTRIHELLQEFDVRSNKPEFLIHACRFKDANDLADHLRTLLANRPPDDSIAVGVDARTMSVIVAGPAAKLASARKIIEEFDKKPLQESRKEAVADLDGDGRPDVVLASYPDIRKYSVAPGTAEAVAKTLLGFNPKVRCIAVQAANEIWVMATPEEHTALAARFKLTVPKKDAEK